MMSEPLVYSALATPFHSDGSIDWDSFEKLLEHQKESGVSGVVIAGTTGESPTLSVQEKLSLVRKARAYLPDSIKVMAGSGSNNTSQSVELSKLSLESGADSLLIVTPPYNKPSISGLKAHYEAINELNAPICLYHVPGRTGHWLSVEQLRQLCEIENVTMVKEASGDLAFFSRAAYSCDAQFLSGDDPTYLASLAIGGSGVVSVVTNVFPKAFVDLSKALTSGNMAQAQTINRILLPFVDILFCESNPSPLKACLEKMQICQNTFRLPMAPISKGNQQKVVKLFRETESALEGLKL